jgi:2-oxoglutarate dehydrogenase complex dehydrogenase (E1) component-like enzyme
VLCWAQEEPENMGAWSFVHARLHRMSFAPLKLTHVARAESASPATGNHKVHEQEEEELVEGALGL